MVVVSNNFWIKFQATLGECSCITVCNHFNLCRNDRQARDLAHCMNHLTISDKSIRRLQDNFPCYKDWLVDTVIHDSFTLLLTKAKKFTKPEVKGQIEELERMMNEAHMKGTGDDKPSMDTAECDSKPSMDTTECKLDYVCCIV